LFTENKKRATERKSNAVSLTGNNMVREKETRGYAAGSIPKRVWLLTHSGKH